MLAFTHARLLEQEEGDQNTCVEVEEGEAVLVFASVSVWRRFLVFCVVRTDEDSTSNRRDLHSAFGPFDRPARIYRASASDMHFPLNIIVIGCSA
jgi:hypothetical protein